MKSQKERMLAQKLYLPGDPELREDALRGKSLMFEYNQTSYKERDKRRSLLKQLFAKTGEAVYAEAPIYVDYGSNITVGERFYANFGCTFLDVARITIGDEVMFGPHVGLYTASHPIDAAVHSAGPELGKEIHIGNRVWIGAQTVVNPGVSIGDNTIIGSGSVVTKDIPANVIAAGNPCRIIREITQADKEYWEKEYERFKAEIGGIK